MWLWSILYIVDIYCPTVRRLTPHITLALPLSFTSHHRKCPHVVSLFNKYFCVYIIKHMNTAIYFPYLISRSWDKKKSSNILKVLLSNKMLSVSTSKGKCYLECFLRFLLATFIALKLIINHKQQWYDHWHFTVYIIYQHYCSAIFKAWKVVGWQQSSTPGVTRHFWLSQFVHYNSYYNKC